LRSRECSRSASGDDAVSVLTRGVLPFFYIYVCTCSQNYRCIDDKGVLFVYIKPNAEPCEIMQSHVVMPQEVDALGVLTTAFPSVILCTLLCGVLFHGGAP
jgi:hypothetical protein